MQKPIVREPSKCVQCGEISDPPQTLPFTCSVCFQDIIRRSIELARRLEAEAAIDHAWEKNRCSRRWFVVDSKL